MTPPNDLAADTNEHEHDGLVFPWTWRGDGRERLRVILCNPTEPRNIGSVVRAAANFGLRAEEIVCVVDDAQRNGTGDFDRGAAAVLAPGLADEVAKVRVVSSLSAALSDCVYAIGFTARLRKGESDGMLRALTPYQAARELRVRARIAAGDAMRDTAPIPPRPRKDSNGEGHDTDPPVQGPRIGRVAAVFGREATGLTDEELDRCHQLGRIPTSIHSSLNLSHAVALIAYEWFLAGVRASARLGSPELAALQQGLPQRDIGPWSRYDTPAPLPGQALRPAPALDDDSDTHIAIAPSQADRARAGLHGMDPRPLEEPVDTDYTDLDDPAPTWAMELALAEAMASLRAIEFFMGGTEKVVMTRLRRFLARSQPSLREARLLTAMAREVRNALGKAHEVGRTSSRIYRIAVDEEE